MKNFQEIIQSDIHVLVDFYADWCAPCKMLSPILQQVKSELGDTVRIIKVNVDKNPAISSRYNIRSIPAIFLFKHGQIKWQGAGVMQPNQIKNVIISNYN
jgi:thioredoxin 1